MLKRKDPPYSGTEVPAARTESQIKQMLMDSGAEAVRITSTNMGEVTIEFILETEIQGVQKKFAVRLKSPEIYRTRGRKYQKIAMRDVNAELRLLHWYTKSLLEAAQYGLMAVEEIFFSHILFTLPNGQTATASEMASRALVEGKQAALPGLGVHE